MEFFFNCFLFFAMNDLFIAYNIGFFKMPRFAPIDGSDAPAR